MSDDQNPAAPMTDEAQEIPASTMALKAVVATLAVAFIAAPVAYGAYEMNDLAAPTLGVWRWPAILVLAAAFVVLAWWVVVSIRRSFPYS